MKGRLLPVLAVAAACFSCEQGPPPGYKTQKKVERELRRAETALAAGKLEEAAASLEAVDRALAAVERLTRKRGMVWARAKKSRVKLVGLRKKIEAQKEEARKRAEEEKRRLLEEAERYVKKEEKPAVEKKKEERDEYVDRDLTAEMRFAAKKRAVEKPPEKPKPKPPEEKPPIPKDLVPEKPVTVTKIEARGQYIVCYVVFYNPGAATYFASLVVDFLDKANKKVTYNRMTFRADGFKPNWSSIYESKGTGVAANELVVGEKAKVGLVGVGDSPRASQVKRVKVTVATTDGRMYTGSGNK